MGFRGRRRLGSDRWRFVLPRLALGLVAAVVLAVLPAAAQPFLKFSLDSRFDARTAPFLLALDQGYLKAEGLDVTIDPAPGSQEAIARVASGTYDLGVADINALIKYRDQNPAVPMPAVFMVFNRPTYSILARRSRGITAPKDLDGKRVGASTLDGSAATLRIFAKLNDIDVGRLKLENVGLPIREPMLASGQVDAISASALTAVDLKARGVPADDILVLLMADYGVRLYGQAVFVNPRLAADRPEVVRAFLRAVLKGLEEMVRDPERAADTVMRRTEARERASEVERVKIAVAENVLTPEVRANGYGAVDMDRLAEAIDQLAISFEFRAKPKPADIFDPSFLPPTAERMP